MDVKKKRGGGQEVAYTTKIKQTKHKNWTHESATVDPQQKNMDSAVKNKQKNSDTRVLKFKGWTGGKKKKKRKKRKRRVESALSLRTKQDTGDFDRQRRTETEREQTHLQAINKTRT